MCAGKSFEAGRFKHQDAARRPYTHYVDNTHASAYSSARREVIIYTQGGDASAPPARVRRRSAEFGIQMSRHKTMARTTRQIKKPGKPSTADEYFAGQTGVARDTLIALRNLVKAALPKATEGFKWGAPVYFSPDGYPLCYLFAVRDHVNLGFLSGAQIEDPKGLLEGSGERGRHIKVFDPADIRKTAFKDLLRGAARVARRQAKAGTPPGCSRRKSK
jgi:hypothetical protein